MSTVEKNVRQGYDKVIYDIADYVMTYEGYSEEALETAQYCLMDSLACAMLALKFPACLKHLGPVVEGTVVPNATPIPGTHYSLDPIKAAFDIGCMIRWLDYNDTWLAAEWGHPSDNLGAILAVADYISRQNVKKGKDALTMQTVLECMVKAHEIQGCIALENSFNKVGLDHVLLVKIASTAVAAKLMGADKETVKSALSQAFVDGQSLRTYRHAPNAGPRKSWAAGDATSRAVRLAMVAMSGETGYTSALSAPTWGFYDVLFKGHPFEFQRPYGCYVMENVLFKISFPAEFHAQTAVECAVTLHESIKDRIDDIEKIDLITHESAIRIISKEGALHNPADRDHCLQYMVACGLLFGDLEAKHYEDDVASNPQIDALCLKMNVSENKQFSTDYHDPEKRSIANAMQITFKDGSQTDLITVEYPIGHKRRRAEGMPVLVSKFKKAIYGRFASNKANNIIEAMSADKFPQMAVPVFMDMWKI
ncbi:MAG: 2-methylcitrate dehydratase [Alphaproteobacteria bacterium]|jgi:2-methylcitrate dehydratase